MNSKVFLPLLSLAVLAGCTQPGQPTAAKPAAPKTGATAPAVVGAFDDDAHPLTAVESSVVAAGKDPAALAALEKNLLQVVVAPTTEAGQAREAARQLGIVLQSAANGPDAATLAALAPLLTEPARADFARLALDRVPGTAVDAVYRDALPRATGRERIGVINSLGVRKVAAAVPALGQELAQEDPAIAAAAASALGRIGGPDALRTLESAGRARAPEILNARIAAARVAGPEALARTATMIYQGSDAPLPSRSAALRALLDADPAGAVAQVDAALRGNVPAFRLVALQAVAGLAPADTSAQLAAHLADYDADVQVALLAALATRADAAAVPGALQALNHADESVRLAAIDALGRLPGSPDVARALAALAARPGAEAKPAFAALARLNGAGVDDFIRGTAADAAAEERLRATCIQQIAARNRTEYIPLLLSLRTTAGDSVRNEALDALRLIGSPAEEPAIIAWALGASAKAEQNRAVRALTTIVLREDDLDRRCTTVVEAIRTGDEKTRAALLPVLSRIGGKPGLAIAETLALGPVEADGTAAVAELARWPDLTALPVLADIAAKTASTTTRAAAMRGAVGLYSRINRVPDAQESAIARRLLALPATPAEKQSLLSVLSLCSDAASLKTAESLLADASVAAAAQDAVDAISSNLAGPPVWSGSAAQSDLPNLSDGNPDTHWMGKNAPGEWIMADMHRSRPVKKVVMDSSDHKSWGYPGHIEICVSDDPANAGPVRAQLDGDKVLNVVQLPAGVRGRYVWIRQTATREAPWSIGELLIQ